MLSNTEGLPQLLDKELIGFMTAVKEDGQPQTSPVWFHREGDDIVVYNRVTARRLRSIAANPKVALNLRGDRRGHVVVTLEGTAVVEPELPSAKDFPGFVEKYGEDITALGWTPDSFSSDYSVGIRMTVTRVRASGV